MLCGRPHGVTHPYDNHCHVHSVNMKTFIATLVLGTALTASAFFVTFERPSGGGFGTVAEQWRMLAALSCLMGPWCVFMSAGCLFWFRKRNRRAGWRREAYTTMQSALAALIAWMSVPAASALIYYRELYAPLDAGGMKDPIPPDVFASLETLWKWIGGLVALAIVVWSLLKGPEFRRRRLAADRRCTKCGYQLKGNVSGRCPECGAPVHPEVLTDRES